MKEERTPWFPVSVKPERSGVYEVRPEREFQSGMFWHSVWRDGEWRVATALGIDMALEYDRKGYVSKEVAKWRGLAKEPK